jgi:hypothetical protein
MATEGSAAFLHIVLTLGILLFASKLFAELFHRIKMPVVLGELLGAKDNDGTLDEESTSYNDIFDAFRLALKFYHFREMA